jgi:hypothetical protein
MIQPFPEMESFFFLTPTDPQPILTDRTDQLEWVLSFPILISSSPC